MVIRKILLPVLVSLMLSGAGWLFRAEAEAVTLQNTGNEDIDVLIATDQYFGNRIGDVILLQVILLHKVEGVEVLDTLSHEGSFGDFEIAGIESEAYKDRTVFSFSLQTFLPPKTFASPAVGSLELHYTAKKYWSPEDQKYVYRKLQTQPFRIFQVSMDPGNDLPLVYEFDYLSYGKGFGYFFMGLGLLLVFVPVYPETKSFLLRYLRDRSYYRNRKFLKKLIEEDLSLYDLANVCRKLNRIRQDDLLIRVLYQQYHPEEGEIRQAAKRALDCLEEKRCNPQK